MREVHAHPIHAEGPRNHWGATTMRARERVTATVAWPDGRELTTPGEDVVLENLGSDVGSDNRTKGPPGQCGSTPGGRDDGDEDTDADQDRHGHKASDEGGESRILSG